MKKINYVKFTLDLLMAVTFVLFFNARVLGGLTFHEIAGIAFAAAYFTHILLNLRWVKNVTLKLFDRKLPMKNKINYILNFSLLVTMTFIVVSGIFISKVVFPNINIANEHWFQMTHISVSFLVLILVAVHVGLHWKWVVGIFHKIVKYKKSKPVLGIIAKVGTVVLLVFGIYETYTTNFMMHLQGLSSIVNPSSIESGFEGKGGHFGDHEETFDGDGEKGKFAPPEGFEGHEGNVKGGKGEFGGHGGFESPSTLGVIGTYSAIMSVFAIVTYYLEKIIMKRRKKPSVMSANKIETV